MEAAPSSSLCARNEIRYQVEHALFQGILHPGDFIGTERDYSTIFGTSRMPVRDALKALQAQGLINVRVGKTGGIYVAEYNKQGLVNALGSQIHLLGCTPEEVFQAQGQLLAAAVELAIERITDKDIKIMERSLHHMEGAIDDDEEFMCETVKNLLHIAEIAGNSILLFQIEALFAFIIEHHHPYDARSSGKSVIRHHNKLLELIKRNDSPGARRHIIEYTSWISTLRKTI
jgi:GntR family transcriptional repressor for pyruvate dehydrogenase complex